VLGRRPGREKASGPKGTGGEVAAAAMAGGGVEIGDDGPAVGARV